MLTEYDAAVSDRRPFDGWAIRVIPVVLKQLMRHESIETTMQYYVGKNAEAAADTLWDALEQTAVENGVGETVKG